MTHYLSSDIELANLDLTPGLTLEMPPSPLASNCGPITYPSFCAANYAGFSRLVGTEAGVKDYETTGIIESTQIINFGAIVDYDSQTEINLLPGFEIMLGADFYGIIDGCNNGAGGLN